MLVKDGAEPPPVAPQSSQPVDAYLSSTSSSSNGGGGGGGEVERLREALRARVAQLDGLQAQLAGLERTRDKCAPPAAQHTLHVPTCTKASQIARQAAEKGRAHSAGAGQRTRGCAGS